MQFPKEIACEYKLGIPKLVSKQERLEINLLEEKLNRKE